MDEAQLSLLAGWKPGSKMPAVYIHLSQRDLKPALQKTLGLEPTIKSIEIKPLKKCPICRTVNQSDAKVCQTCKMALDTQTAVEMIRDEDGRVATLEERLQTRDQQIELLISELQAQKERLDRIERLAGKHA